MLVIAQFWSIAPADLHVLDKSDEILSRRSGKTTKYNSYHIML